MAPQQHNSILQMDQHLCEAVSTKAKHSSLYEWRFIAGLCCVQH